MWVLSSALVAKGFGYFAKNCSKKFCHYCKKPDHIIKECSIRPLKKSEKAYSVSVDSSNAFTYVNTASLPSNFPSLVQSITLEMIRQMIISTFSALRVSGKNISIPQPWYFDSRASYHMTKNIVLLTLSKSIQEVSRYILPKAVLCLSLLLVIFLLRWQLFFCLLVFLLILFPWVNWLTMVITSNFLNLVVLCGIKYPGGWSQRSLKWDVFFHYIYLYLLYLRIIFLVNLFKLTTECGIGA